MYLSMIASMVLGMGLPSIPAYIITATMAAPALAEFGIPILLAHMFVFYFGIVADITPPVALAAYAGSAIARSNPLKTGVQATKLAIAAFLIPYVFALNPSLLLVGSTPLQVVSVTITAFIGMFGVASAVEGYLFANMNPIIRIIALAGGMMLIIPGIATDIAGISLVALVFVFQKIRSKKANSANSCGNCNV